MTKFLNPTDIGNRAAQHCGQDRMGSDGFAENSKKAAEIGFLYDKLRRAELQRNTWRFAIREAALRPISTTTLLLAPALWVQNTTYYRGSIVADENGVPWISNIRQNIGNQPQNSTTWDAYFGPMTVSLWDTTGTTAYVAGELVYTTAGDGTNRVYLSLQSANSDNPATATAWDATVTYMKDQVITRSAVAYQSLIDLNKNQDPALAPALWAAGTTYALNARVGGSDGVIYRSLAGGNVANNPITDLGVHWLNTNVLNPWTTVFVGGAGSAKWLQIGGAEFPNGVTVVPLNIQYPLGSGPSSQDTTRNVYRLPASFLRKAPQDPKAGSTSWLGAPSGRVYDDWNFEGSYIVTSQSDVIRLRFVADTVDVATFDDMFCEGLGARIGYEVCEALTQSTNKQSAIAQAYGKFMSDARTNNAILIGSEEPPLDDFLACRA